jgi:TonB family protein
MKVSALAIIALCLWANSLLQVDSLQKQALNLVQSTQASDLDPALPKVAVNLWFNQLVGPRAGVNWQLSECGEPIAGIDNKEPDLPACIGANAILQDGRKVVMTILIGTFRKGLTGKASFDFAVVESEEQLRAVKKLSDLPRLIADPRQLAGKPPTELPDVNAGTNQIKALPQTINPSGISKDKDALTAELDSGQPPSRVEEVPPPPPTQLQNSEKPQGPQRSQRLSNAILDGIALSRVNAVYPPTARMLKAYGVVKVQITISEDGRVIDAKAISGHQALRPAAVDAAYRWVFKPTTLNGEAIKVQGILTFYFRNSP